MIGEILTVLPLTFGTASIPQFTGIVSTGAFGNSQQSWLQVVEEPAPVYEKPYMNLGFNLALKSGSLLFEKTDNTLDMKIEQLIANFLSQQVQIPRKFDQVFSESFEDLLA